MHKIKCIIDLNSFLNLTLPELCTCTYAQKQSIKNNFYTYVCLTCGNIKEHVCLHASTHDRRSFRTFSRSSGQSLDEPMCISKSRNSAT